MYHQQLPESLESLLFDVEKSDLIDQLSQLLTSAAHYADKNYTAHQWMNDISAEKDNLIPRDVTWPEAIQASLIYVFINRIRKN